MWYDDTVHLFWRDRLLDTIIGVFAAGRISEGVSGGVSWVQICPYKPVYLMQDPYGDHDMAF